VTKRTVLTGARVADGTGAEPYPATVVLADGRIEAVDRAQTPGDGDRFDLEGLTLFPGFIDAHSHSDIRVFREPLLPMKLLQGITTEILGQDGISVAPVRPPGQPVMARILSGLDGEYGDTWPWGSVSEYLNRVQEARPAQNMAYLVPHGNLRLCVVGMEQRAATAGELEAMARLLEQGLDEGACGMSAGLIYPPSAYGDVDELARLCAVLAGRDAVFVVHIRSESDRVLAALDEVHEACRRGGCRLHVSHLKLGGSRNWGEVGRVLEFLDRSQAAGVETTADQYPYAAGSTMLGAILPLWAHAGGVDRVVARLRDPGERARLRADILAPPPHDWDNFWSCAGPGGIVIADVPSGRRPEWVGRDFAAVAGEIAADPLDTAFDLLADERLGVGMISFSQSEDVVDRFARDPRVCGCTDALLGGKPHPRAYGAFPRILSRYVREGDMTPGAAARKLAGLPAAVFGLEDRGLVRAGCHADLTAVDLTRVRDRATFEEPAVPPEGIPFVWVGGTLAVRDGRPTGAREGRVLRGVARS